MWSAATVDDMCARGFGRIVNITSVSVKSPIATLGLSNGARAGLTGFVAGVARQVAEELLPVVQRIAETVTVGVEMEGQRRPHGGQDRRRLERIGKAAEDAKGTAGLRKGLVTAAPGVSLGGSVAGSGGRGKGVRCPVGAIRHPSLS